MALNVGTETLAMVRKSVAVRCNLGNQPTRIKQIQPVMDEFIQEAHVYLTGLCDWVAGLRSEDIKLVNAQQTYDFPDDCLAGNIDVMVVVDMNGNEYELESGMRPQERNSVNPSWSGQGVSQPLRWTIENGAIKVWPSPDTSSWSTLRLRYRASPTRPMEEDDKIVVDFETLVKFAAHKLRKFMGLPPNESDEEMMQFIDVMIAQQDDGEIFDFIGRRSVKNRHGLKNRINSASTPVSGPGWVPPGF